MLRLFTDLWAKNKAEEKENLKVLLKYKDQPIGTLWFQKGAYYFKYDSSFEASGLRPIIDFPEVSVIYESKILFPFFDIRIPSRKRTEIEKIISKMEEKNPTRLELLLELGKKSINDPYTIEKSEQ